MLDVAKKLAFAGRHELDQSENADVFWKCSSPDSRATYMKMAEAVADAPSCVCCGAQEHLTVASNSGLCDGCTELIMIEKNPMNAHEICAHIGLVAAIRLANDTAVEAGWYNDPKTGKSVARNFGEVVALMHSELSEALEADRRGAMDEKLPWMDGRTVEFADTMIRIGDTSEALGLEVADAFIQKNRFNKLRADHKASARRGVKGKAY